MIQTKKPMIKETVGGMYYAFNTPSSDGEFNAETYETEVSKCNNIKDIKTTENTSSSVVKASGEDYETISQNENIDMAIQVVAFDPGDLARMRGDIVGANGLNRSGRSVRRPFFAFGKVVKKFNNKFEYAWYPKCQLVENTDDIATSEENFSEQNDTVTIRAYSFNDDGDKKNYVNNEMSNFPEGLTEERFFAAPILTDTDLTNAIEANGTAQDENVEGA